MGCFNSKKRRINAIKVAINLLDEFDGETDPKAFLRKIVALKDSISIESKTLKNIALSKMTGKARAWMLSWKLVYPSWTLNELLEYIYFEFDPIQRRIRNPVQPTDEVDSGNEAGLEQPEKPQLNLRHLMEMYERSPALVKKFIKHNGKALEVPDAKYAMAALERFLTNGEDNFAMIRGYLPNEEEFVRRQYKVLVKLINDPKEDRDRDQQIMLHVDRRMAENPEKNETESVQSVAKNEMNLPEKPNEIMDSLIDKLNGLKLDP